MRRFRLAAAALAVLGLVAPGCAQTGGSGSSTNASGPDKTGGLQRGPGYDTNSAGGSDSAAGSSE